MRFTWDEAKRKRNLKDHGLDFVDAEQVFNGPTFTYEDDRFHYEEQRLVTLGLFKGIPVSIVHTETRDHIHIISFRKATRRETTIRRFQDRCSPRKSCCHRTDRYWG